MPRRRYHSGGQYPPEEWPRQLARVSAAGVEATPLHREWSHAELMQQPKHRIEDTERVLHKVSMPRGAKARQMLVWRLVPSERCYRKHHDTASPYNRFGRRSDVCERNNVAQQFADEVTSPFDGLKRRAFVDCSRLAKFPQQPISLSRTLANSDHAAQKVDLRYDHGDRNIQGLSRIL